MTGAAIIQPPLFGVQQVERTSDDYYTPAWVFERMGLTFDLDVCSPPGGVPWIPTARHFTMEDDGLAHPWVGRVWMNPPFSEPKAWVERFIEHGHGVCLIPASNGEWFHKLWLAADGLSVPFPTAMKWHTGTSVPTRVLVAAFGDECVNAIAKLGRVRT